MDKKIKAVIFDLDGVIVNTDEFHFQAWLHMSQKEGIPFDRRINERLRGVSRMESLEIILEKAKRKYSDSEKLAMTIQKNDYYKRLLRNLKTKDILPGVSELIAELKKRGIKVAIGSSSKNTLYILQMLNMTDCFDAIADGNGIKNSKPDPEVFLLAAKLLNIRPENCAVIEDACAGIDAALAAGSKAIAVGYAAAYDKADYAVSDLTKINIEKMLK